MEYKRDHTFIISDFHFNCTCLDCLICFVKGVKCLNISGFFHEVLNVYSTVPF